MAKTYSVYEQSWGYDEMGEVTGWSERNLIKTFDSEEEAVEFIRSAALDPDDDDFGPYDGITIDKCEDEFGSDVTYYSYQIDGYDDEDEEP